MITAIVGYGAFAQYVAEITTLRGDEYQLFEIPPPPSRDFIFAIAPQRPGDRRLYAIQAEHGDAEIGTFIHPSASVAGTASIGEGSIVAPGVVVEGGATIGRYVVLQSNAVIGNDAKIADFVNVGQGAKIGGKASIAEGVTIFMNATVTPYKVISRDALIDAGAVVIRDVPEGHRAYGVPARNRPLGET